MQSDLWVGYCTAVHEFHWVGLKKKIIDLKVAYQEKFWRDIREQPVCKL